MKQIIKRALALSMALLLALPTFVLSEEDEVFVLPADEPVEEKAYSLGDDTDIVTLNADGPESEKQEESEAFDAGEALPEGLVRVSLVVMPEEATVAIFKLNPEMSIEDQLPIEPQMGADWLLAPGIYEYSAWAEGFAHAEHVAFEVTAQDGAFELEIALEKMETVEEAPTIEQAEESAEESDEGAAEQQTKEPAEVTTEAPVEEQTEKPAEVTAEALVEEQTKEPAEESTEEVKEVVEESVEEAAEESAEGQAENAKPEIEEAMVEAIEEDDGITEEPEASAEPEQEMEPEQEELTDIAFAQTCVVDGVAVTVSAEAGAFPADARLSVTKVAVYRQREADVAVAEAREDDVNVAVSYTFDIKVLDAEGSELQPAEGMSVFVSFTLAEVADANLETSVYHITEDESGELTADRLDAVEDAVGQTVEAETDGFSLYTVEFTYNALQYVLRGEKSVPLSAVLDAVGLVGEAEGASVSDPALFSVSNETGEWILTSHQPFDTTEWLKVVIAGVEYEITVTDEEVEADDSFDSWEALQMAVNEAEDGEALALDDNLCAEDEDASALVIPEGKAITLDLNGFELSRALGEPVADGCVIIVYGDLTLIDQAEGGVVTGGMNRGNGGGIYVAAGGSLTLDGAVVEGNFTGGNGGGVYAAGSFTMNSGEIEGNEAGDMSGGVYFENTFAMNGGSLRDNTPEDVRLEKPMTVSGEVRISNAYLPAGSAAYRFLVAGALDGADIELNVPKNAVGDGGLRVTQGLSGQGALTNFRMGKSGEHDVALDDAGEVVIHKYAVVTLFAGDGYNTSTKENVLGGTDYILPNGGDLFAAPEGQPFTAWLLEDGTLKRAGETIRVTESLSLTAQWALTWSGLQGMINAAQWSDTLQLSCGLVRGADDDSAYITIPADKKVTLDLAGCALDGAGIGEKAVIYIEEGGDLTLVDTVGGGRVTGGTAGGVVVNGGSFTLRGGLISGNASKALGGGVLVNSGSFTMLGDGAVSGNTAENGGGVGVAGGSFEIRNGSVAGNKASNGGGVAVAGGSLVMSGGKIGENEASNGGGVSVHDGAAFEMAGGSVYGNTASSNGGGLLLEKGVSVELDGGNINKNSATGQGGGIYADGLDFALSGASVTENKADLGGGVADSAGVFTLEGGSVSQNTANSQGGGLYVVKSAAYLSGGSVSGNSAQYGGGAFIAEGALSMPKNIITDNTATGGGAGVAFSNMKPQLSGVACVRGNTVGGAEANYWLQDGAVFTAAEPLDSDYVVYVSAEMGEGETRIIAAGEKLFRDNFVSADGKYAASRDMDGNMIFGLPLTVRFSAGDGGGSLPDDTAARGGAYTLPGADGLTAPSGKALQGWRIVNAGYWDTETKGVGTNLPIDGAMLNNGVLNLEAQWGNGTLYVDENGTTRTVGLAKPLTSCQSKDAVTLDTGWYLADGATFDARVTIRGDVNIIVDSIHTTAMNAGILVPAGSSLSVWGQGGWETGSGKLVANGGETSNAGIGGTTLATPGAFELHSGVVEATGGANAAGIGGGDGVYGGTVVIHGGKLTAKGGQSGAGIGGGMSASQGGMVSIYGGTVYAYGGDDAAGIGGGKYSGTVAGSLFGGNGAQVVVAGATVHAEGGLNGAGIGGGYGGSGGSVSIGAGSTVTATAGRNTYQGSANEQPQAIGRGYYVNRYGMGEGSLTLTDSCVVDAGDAAASTTHYITGREAACRKNYAKITPTGSVPAVFAINAQDVDSERTAIAITRASDLTKPINEASFQEKIAVKIAPAGTYKAYNHYDGIEITYTYHGETFALTDYEVQMTGEEALVTFEMPRGAVYVHPIMRTDTFKITINITEGADHGSAYASVDGVTVVEAPVGKDVHINCVPENDDWFLDVQQENTQDESTYQPYVTCVENGKTTVLETPAVGGDRNVRTFTMRPADVTVNLAFRERVFYYEKDGTRQFKYYFNTLTGGETEIKANGKAGSWYYVGQSLTYSSRVTISSEINLILGEGVTLTFNQGLRVPYNQGGKLYLYEEVKDGGSKLVADASGQENCAGIGGNNGEQGGTVCIVGGTVTAKGGHKGAGIGGGNHDGLFEYEQYGGHVTATGGKYGAGVGGGEGYGGSVEDGIRGSVTIHGGTLTANGGEYAAGIGGGQSMHQGKPVTVEGGSVYAYGGRDGAGIGGGEEFDPTSSRQVGGNGGDVTIHGGYVKAVGGGGDGAAGIGGGQDGKGGHFVMTGGEVYAKGQDNAAGIGGQDNVGGDVDIRGGYVKAVGGKNGAGIGGADDHKCGTINISGGDVYAKGGANAAGIGGGGDGEGGTINITGGYITAEGGEDAAGIGGGDGGYVSSISIRRANIRSWGDEKAIGGGDGADKDSELTLTGAVYATDEYFGDGTLASDGVSACRNNKFVRIINCRDHVLDTDTIFKGVSRINPLDGTSYCQVTGYCKNCNALTQGSVEHVYQNYVPMQFDESKRQYVVDHQQVDRYEYHRLVGTCKYCGEATDTKAQEHHFQGDVCTDCGFKHPDCTVVLIPLDRANEETIEYTMAYGSAFELPDYPWTLPGGSVFKGWSYWKGTEQPHTWISILGYTTIWPIFEHKHDGITFKPWDATNALPKKTGYYYLLNDVTLDSTWTCPGDVHLCLAGHTVTCKSGSAILVGGESLERYHLTAYDCAACGELRTDSSGKPTVTLGKRGFLTLKSATIRGVYRAVYADNYGQFDMEGGVIDGVPVYLGFGCTMDMTGGKITGNTGDGAVLVGTEFNMKGGEITDNKVGVRVLGSTVDKAGGTFTMTGGEIHDNHSSGPSGVYIDPYGQFNMKGGSIHGNSGSTAVAVGGQFTMTGGEIVDNTLDLYGAVLTEYQWAEAIISGGRISNNHNTYGNGGGVTVGTATRSFTMTGGEISGNSAAKAGGGVFISDGVTFKLSGYTYTTDDGRREMSRTYITGNTAGTYGGGVFVSSSASFNIAGVPTVTGNTVDGKDNNVYLSRNRRIDASGLTILNGARIGITTAVAPTKAAPVTICTNLLHAGQYSGYYVFTSDNPDYYVLEANDQAVLMLYTDATVCFDANGGSGSMPDEVWEARKAHAMPACAFTPPADHVFDGWRVVEEDKVYQPGESYTPTMDITLQAQWKRVTVTVRFDISGVGGSLPDEHWALNERHALPECGVAAPEGFAFAGWRVSDETGLRQPGDEITASEDMTLTAVFEHRHGDLIFISWNSSDSLPDEPGNYYLTKDVVTTQKWEVPMGTLNLCLNGHKLRFKNYSVTVEDGQMLGLYDDGDEGCVVNESAELRAANGGVLNLEGATLKCSITISSDSALNLRAGRIVDARVFVATSGTMNMSGGAIVDRSYKGDYAVSIFEGTMNMSGGEIARNAGGAVYCLGTFTMTGGEIHDNTGGGNGSVFARSLNLSGGRIYNNTSAFGVKASNSFTMTGGEITDNTATGDGGGVYLYSTSKDIDWTITGGRISGNKAGGNGGGIYMYDYYEEAVVTLSNVEITDNSSGGQGGGVFRKDGGTTAISGNVRVTGNTMGKLANNVYLEKDRKMKVSGALAQSALIGVTARAEPTKAAPVVLTEGLAGKGSADNFASDDERFYVDLGAKGEAALCLIDTGLDAPAFRTHSLLLTGEIGVNFFMELPELEGVDYSKSYMEFTVQSKNGATTKDPFDPDDRDVNGNGYYGFTVNVNAIQMAAPIKAVFHYGNGQTVEQTYSVKDYVTAYEKVSGSFDASTTALIHAIANYGHYAQPILAKTNGWTIGKDYAEMDVYYSDSLDISAAAEALSGYSAKLDTIAPGAFDIPAFTLNLLSNTEMRVMFTDRTSETIYYQEWAQAMTYLLDEKPVSLVKYQEWHYYLSIPSIPAHRLGDSHTLVIKPTNGSRAYATYTFSPLCYVNSLIQQSDAESKQAAAAIYYYYKAVKDYRAAHGY